MRLGRALQRISRRLSVRLMNKLTDKAKITVEGGYKNLPPRHKRMKQIMLKPDSEFKIRDYS
jgi:hypothetical protein